MKPELSIIIPTLQEEKHLPLILNNLTKNLKMIKYEIIVSDGGSTDKTINIARKYKAIVIENKSKKKQNIAIGRNLGAKKAKAKYIVFLDTDVIIKNPLDFFSKAMNSFKERNLVALTSNIRVLPKNEKFLDYITFFWLNSVHKIRCNLFNMGQASGEFQMFSKKSFQKIKGYNEHLPVGEDYDIFERISKLGRVRLELSLVVYHTGRRADKTGWPLLILSWTTNYISRVVFKKTINKEWEVIR